MHTTIFSQKCTFTRPFSGIVDDIFLSLVTKRFGYYIMKLKHCPVVLYCPRECTGCADNALPSVVHYQHPQCIIWTNNALQCSALILHHNCFSPHYFLPMGHKNCTKANNTLQCSALILQKLQIL